MSKLSSDDYATIAAAFTAKGFSPDAESKKPVFPALKKAGFKVKIGEKVFTNVYASRVIALMHESIEDGDALEL